jgi:CheY-like chemotaxis protein
MTKRILVIDDDDGIRWLLQLSLKAAAGWEVLTAASGPEGIATAAIAQPDAILLDVTMPELDGWETFQQLQANPLTQPIPAILLTAQASSRHYQRFIDAGIQGLIAKPCKAQALVDQMRSYLNWET